MGINFDPDLFRDKIRTFSQDMVHVCVQMDNLAIISNDTYENRMDVIYDILKWLEKPEI